MRKTFQASNPGRRPDRRWQKPLTRNDQREVRRFGGLIQARTAATYPEVPAGWPNRATRRAVKQNRLNRLSGEWRQVLAARPELIPLIRAL